MAKLTLRLSILRKAIIAFTCMVILTACDRTSSPEGRMQIKLEDLQRALIDSLQKQHAAVLDSLGKMREDIQRLQKQDK